MSYAEESSEVGLTVSKSVASFLTWQDVPRLCASSAVFCASMGFGAGLAVLGAGLPDIADSLHIPSTSLGILFTCRGLGVLIGASFSAYMLESQCFLSKHMMACISVIVAGLSMIAAVFLSSAENATVSSMYLPFIAQGACFGAIDSFSTVAIAEMWGQRQQPWMQMKNMTSGLGAVIAPLLVARFSWQQSFIFISLLGCSSLIGVIAENWTLPYFTVKESDMPPLAPEAFSELDNDAEATTSSSMNTGIAFQNGRSLQLAKRYDSNSSLTQVNGASTHEEGQSIWSSACGVAQCMVPFDDHVLLADEHTTLTNSLAAIDRKELRDTDNWKDLTDEVLHTIDYAPPIPATLTTSAAAAAAAAVVSLNAEDDEEEKLPLYQPQEWPVEQLPRTLSFAPSRIAASARTDANFGVVLVPPHVRLALIFFGFWQIGMLYSCGGWLSTYVLMSGIADEDFPSGAPSAKDIAQYAIFVPTMFFISQTLFSIISVPLSILLPPTIMMRFHLALVVVGCMILLLSARLPPYEAFLAAACTLGAGLSCLYPLTMTIVNDYGATMDSRSTVSVVMGACLGESVAPVAVGMLMASFGAQAFPIYICVATLALVSAYLFLHLYLRKNITAVFYKEEFSLLARSRAVTMDNSDAGKNAQAVVDLVHRMLPAGGGSNQQTPPPDGRSRAASRARAGSSAPPRGRSNSHVRGRSNSHARGRSGSQTTATGNILQTMYGTST